MLKNLRKEIVTTKEGKMKNKGKRMKENFRKLRSI